MGLAPIFLTKKYFLFLFIFISLLLHLVFAFRFSLYIDARGSPSVYAWNDIISKKDLFFEKKPVEFLPEAFSSSASLNRDYFSPLLRKEAMAYPEEETDGGITYLPLKALPDQGFLPAERNHYFYLWEKEKGLSPSDEEVISYRAYISPKGRVIFLYPEKLPVDSCRGLVFQDYIREAALFPEGKFFWTKLEAVVK